MSVVITALLPILKEYSYYSLPNRNFLLFDGKPLYQVMIEKLLKVPQFESIVICTDSEEVKEFCKSNGKLRIIDRPESLTSDDIRSDKVTAYTLENTGGEYFIEFQSFIPLLSHQSIEDFSKNFLEYVVSDTHFDSMFTIRRYEYRNYDLDKRELNNNYNFVIFENEIIQGFSRTSFNKNNKQKAGKKPMLDEVKEIEAIPIDSQANYELAKLVLENRSKFPNIFS